MAGGSKMASLTGQAVDIGCQLELSHCCCLWASVLLNVVLSLLLLEFPHSMVTGFQGGMFQVVKVKAADLVRLNLRSYTITSATFC